MDVETDATRNLGPPDPTLIPATPISVPYKPRISRKFLRTKLGCLTCRTRRKKCDQRFPICQNCEKRKVECSWPPSTTKPPREQGEDPLISEDGHRTVSGNPEAELSRRRGSGAASTVISSPEFPRSSPSIVHASTAPWYTQWSLSYHPNFLPSPGSRLLFERYLFETSTELGVTANPQNPFVGYVIPLAFSDELYMNCVLALSGADLSVEETIDPATKSIAWSHYSLAVRGLHKELSNHTYGDVHRTLHLLFLTMSMVMVELMSNTPTPLIFPHLLASRHLIHRILSSPKFLSGHDQISLFGFVFELYTIRALGGSTHRREQLATPIPHNLLNLDFFLGSLVSTSQYPFYSPTFEHKGHLLSSFVPPIASLVSRWTSDAENIDVQAPHGSNSTFTYIAYQNLASRLRIWKPPQPKPENGISPGKAIGAIIYQNALLIYLHAIFLSPSTSPPPSTTDSVIMSEIQTRIDICLPLISAVYPSRMEGVILWPSMIVGSCLTKEEDIDVLRVGMRRARYKLTTVMWVGEVLERLWNQKGSVGDSLNDGSFRHWGPRGLATVIESGP